MFLRKCSVFLNKKTKYHEVLLQFVDLNISLSCYNKKKRVWKLEWDCCNAEIPFPWSDSNNNLAADWLKVVNWIRCSCFVHIKFVIERTCPFVVKCFHQLAFWHWLFLKYQINFLKIYPIATKLSERPHQSDRQQENFIWKFDTQKWLVVEHSCYKILIIKI